MPNVPCGHQGRACKHIQTFAELFKRSIYLLETLLFNNTFTGLDNTFQPANVSNRSRGFADLPFAHIAPDWLAADSLAYVEVTPSAFHLPCHVYYNSTTAPHRS
jgi:hypothetical protein